MKPHYIYYLKVTLRSFDLPLFPAALTPDDGSNNVRAVSALKRYLHSIQMLAVSLSEGARWPKSRKTAQRATQLARDYLHLTQNAC